MENDMKQSIYLDFFGLPGSGKTTIANVLVYELKKRGYTIQNNIGKINNEYNVVSRLLTKIINFITFTFKNFSYMKELFLFIRRIDFNNRVEILKQLINIGFVLTNVNNHKNEDFIIADQGVAQA